MKRGLYVVPESSQTRDWSAIGDALIVWGIVGAMVYFAGRLIVSAVFGI